MLLYVCWFLLWCQKPGHNCGDNQGLLEPKMTDKDAAKSALNGAKGWLTRDKKALERLVNASPIDDDAVRDGIDDLNRRIIRVEECCDAYVVHLDTEQELAQEIDVCATQLDEAKTVRRKALKLVRPTQDDSIDSNFEGVKLPKIDLPKFHGKKGQWQGFWETFETSVDQRNISDVTKFTYLKRVVKDEAAKVIQGLSLEANNYALAVELLKKRYGRKPQLIFEHIQALLQLDSLDDTTSPKSIRSLLDATLIHTRSLEKLGVTQDTYGTFLTPLILSKLPQSICLEWARGSENKEGDLQYLLDFLNKEVERLERCGLFEKPPGKEHSLTRGHGSAAALTALTVDSKCGFCEKPHKTVKCFSFLNLSITDRRQRVKESGLCFRCLSGKHKAAQCNKTCTKCGNKHHILCCPKEDSSNDNSSQKKPDAPKGESQTVSVSDPEVSPEVPAYCQSDNSLTFTVMPTAKVKVKGKNGRHAVVTVLLDCGSDRTYISSDVVQKVDLDLISAQKVSYTAFGGTSPKVQIRNKYSVTMIHENGSTVDIEAVEIPVICGQMCRPTVPNSVMCDVKLRGLSLADPEFGKRLLKIDILIGLDNIWQILSSDQAPHVLCKTPPLVAQPSIFGYVISGSVIKSSDNWSENTSSLVSMSDPPEALLRQLWDLESVGVSRDEKSHDDTIHEDFLKNKLKYDTQEKRYEVGLTWKKEHPVLLNNMQQAQKHAVNLERRLLKVPDVAVRYYDYFDELERADMIEQVPPEEIQTSNTVHYLQHRPVVRESSTSTKVRPVFNASQPGPNRVSLNDCLDKGPTLIPLAPPILLRFRRWPVGLASDVVKAFLQILLERKDRDVHRVIIVKNGEMRIMRFKRVTFGVSCSPFLLNAVIKHHLSQYDKSNVIVELDENLYVDDWLSGANSEQEARQLFSDAMGVMSEAGMTLAKWSSNSGIFDKSIDEDGLSQEDMVKVLGIVWSKNDDCLKYEGLKVDGNLQPTKRLILSLLARMYDPLGYSCPFIMIVKTLFQQCWQQGLQWDEPLPEELFRTAMKWIKGIEVLKELKIPRCYSQGKIPWSPASVELHVFSDASQQGYGCAVYVKIPLGDGTFISSLVFARARVAPMKTQTLPRLELLGCVMAAQSLKLVSESLKLESGVYKCYTDSKIALAWIQSDPVKWKQWVSNRVKHIQEITDPQKWSHVPGKENPADLLTRGLEASKLIDNDLWFLGPPVLRSEATTIHDSNSDEMEMESLELVNLHIAEEESDEVVLVNFQPMDIIDVSRIGSYPKAIRVMAWARRFVNNLKAAWARRLVTNQKKPAVDQNFGELSVIELKAAQICLWKQVQEQAFTEEIGLLKNGKLVPKSSKLFKFSPKLDDDGILRKTNRTEFSAMAKSAVYPILLPKGHLAKILVRFVHNACQHQGVNAMITTVTTSFWIIGLRGIAKDVKKSCTPCQKIDAKSYNEIAAPLPKERVTKAPPFTVTGVQGRGDRYERYEFSYRAGPTEKN